MSSGTRWADLRLRLISAVVMVTIGAACLMAGGVSYALLILLTMFGLVWEGEALLGHSRTSWRGILMLVWPVAAGIAALKGSWHEAVVLSLASMIFGLPTCIPVMIAAFGGLSLLWLRGLPYGLQGVLFVFAVVVASDSFAYLTGRIFGGPKLAPSISPGKTRSGAIGGLVGAALIGGAVAACVGIGPVYGGMLWGGFLGFCAQSGDLLESAAKRRLGVKDSGQLIPGHGGLLDRFDGLLAAAPVAACASLVAPGQVFWSLAFTHWSSVGLGAGASVVGLR
ncbi:phosphatidate cytidylyltransferase [Neokomagataea anthophila]|uniref:Phosphatidate cytidylyltransferase n=1 Tax=Neokomagataea anthophila TaxID=2826925 RepID=A0ABS5E4C4_9PROT|nr:phosphatidate cytidylyltransferase [Neokomagataea anthophila]MBR0558757.1 phosphatidate cytidylyltransferase [Neokomagataea anthophila]